MASEKRTGVRPSFPARPGCDIPQAAATSVWAAVVADKDLIGGRYLEDCAIAMLDDTSNPFADGARQYVFDADKASRLWSKSEELINAVG